jgi:predicted MFS family arabinose efflux permease
MTQVFISAFRLYRDAYSGHPREIWNLAILTFINRMGTMVLPFLSVYLTSELCFTLSEAGLLAGAFGVGSFVGVWLGGKWMDRIGPRPIIFLSLIMGGVFLFCMQYMQTVWGLAPIMFLASMFGEAYRPAMMASVAGFVPKEETGRSMALLRLAINLGFSLGPALGGFLIATLGYSAMFWVDSITCVLAGIYFWFSSTHWKPHSREEEVDPQTGQKVGRALSPYRNAQYLLMLFATLLVGIAFIQWFHSVPVFLKQKWLYDEWLIGLLMAINGLLIAVVEMPIIHLIEKAGKKGFYQAIGLVLIALSFAPFLLPKGLVFAFMAMIFLTVGEIFFLPLNSSTLLNMAPASRRGEYMALYSMMWSIGHIVGPAGGMALAGWIGFGWFWIFVMGLGGSGLYLYVRNLRRTPA